MEIFIFIFWFAQLATTLYTTPPTWLSSSLVKSGDAYVISTLTDSSSTSAHTFTFSSAFSAVPFFGFGLKAYEGYDYLGQQKFQIKKSYLSSTSFAVQVQIVGITNIMFLNVQYIGIEPSFPHHINTFDNVPVNYSKGALSNITIQTNATQIYTNRINYTQQAAGLNYNYFLEPFARNKILLFLNTMFMLGKTQANVPGIRPVNLSISTNAVSSNQYQIYVSLSILVRIERLHFSVIIFDELDVISSKTYALVYEIIQLPYTGGFIPVPIEFIQNFIMGLLDFSTNKTQAILDFQWHFLNSSSLQGVFMPQSIGQTYSALGIETANEFRFSFFYLKTWICPNSTFFDLTLNLCTQCALSNCIQCFNLTACDQCNETEKYFLNLTSMLCSQCSLVGCIDCFNLATCLICDSSRDYFLVAGTCQYCNTSANMFLNSFNQCQSNSTTNNQSICGDNILVLSEQCDDGNLINNDGCSQNCIIQPQFGCLPNPDSSFLNSVCYYMGQITLEVIYIEKIDNANQIQILVKIGPNDLAFWDQVNFQEMITLSNMSGIDTYTIHRNQDGSVSIVINYNQDIQNMEITVQLDPSLSGHASLSQIDPVSRTFNLQTTDNQSILYYDQDVYNLYNVVSVLASITAGLALLLFIIAMISGKLVGVQMMQVIQIVYLSLFTIDELNPCFVALKNIWFVNGFNYFSLTKNHLIDAYTPKRIKSLHFYSRFMENYNLTFTLILIPYTAALTCYVISKLCIKNNQKLKYKMLRASKKLACYYAFNGVMFSAYVIIVSSFLQAMYGVKLINTLIGSISIVQMIVLLLIYIANFLLIIWKKKHFGEFSKSFIHNQNGDNSLLSQGKDQQVKIQRKDIFQVVKQFICTKWYNLLMIERFLVGALMIILLTTKLPLLFPILFFVLLMLITLVFRPYNKLYHNIRFALNMLICIVILVIYTLYSNENKSSMQANKQFRWLIMPIIICVLLLICVIYSFVIFFYQIVIQCRSKKSKKIDDYDENTTMSKINKQQLQYFNELSNRPHYHKILPSNGKKQIDSLGISQENIIKIKQILEKEKLGLKRKLNSQSSNNYYQNKYLKDDQNGQDINEAYYIHIKTPKKEFNFQKFHNEIANYDQI